MGCDLISHQTSHAEMMAQFTRRNKYGIGIYLLSLFIFINTL